MIPQYVDFDEHVSKEIIHLSDIFLENFKSALADIYVLCDRMAIKLYGHWKLNSLI